MKALKFRLPDLESLPNRLTLFRIAVVPILLLLFPLDIGFLNLFCAFLFAAAAFTDWLDGFIARRFGLESKLGALLDPIADKMLTTAAIVLVAHSHALWAWMAGLLLCREIALSGLRLIAAQQGITIAVNTTGKWKTLFLDLALVCLMVNRPLWDLPFRTVGIVAVWIALALSLISAYQYSAQFIQRSLKEDDSEPKDP